MWPRGLRRLRAPPRRARRPRARSRRAAGGRRARSRRRAARRAAVARTTTRRRHTRSSAAPRAGSAPPPTRATVSSTSPADQCGESLCSRPHRRDRLREHPQHRDLAARPLGVERHGERALERGQRELVRPQGALKRMPTQPLDQVGAAGEDPRLRAAEQLVAREAHDVGHRLRGSRPPSTRRRSPTARPSRGRRRVAAPPVSLHPRAVGQSRLLGESDDAKVRLVDPQDRRSLRADRALVVGDPRAVRRPDLDEAGSRAREHIGDPEAVADLDQLPTRDDHLAPFGESGKREHHRCGVVVDDERCLGAGEPAEQPGEMILTRAPCACLEVVLEIRVAAARPRSRGRARPARAGRGRDWCGSGRRWR